MIKTKYDRTICKVGDVLVASSKATILHYGILIGDDLIAHLPGNRIAEAVTFKQFIKNRNLLWIECSNYSPSQCTILTKRAFDLIQRKVKWSPFFACHRFTKYVLGDIKTYDDPSGSRIADLRNRLFS